MQPECSDGWFYRDDSPQDKPDWRDAFSDPMIDVQRFTTELAGSQAFLVGVDEIQAYFKKAREGGWSWYDE